MPKYYAGNPTNYEGGSSLVSLEANTSFIPPVTLPEGGKSSAPVRFEPTYIGWLRQKIGVPFINLKNGEDYIVVQLPMRPPMSDYELRKARIEAARAGMKERIKPIRNPRKELTDSIEDL